MGTKNLVMLKTHINSITLCFPNDFVFENLIWALASIWLFLCNYVVHFMGLILTYIFRNQRKNEQVVPLDLAEQIKRNQFEDYEIDKFTEEVANLIFPSYEDLHIESEEEREGETEYSVLVENDSDIQQDDENGKGEIDSFLNEETKWSFFMHSVSHDVKKVDEYETECSVFIKGDSNLDQDGRKSVKTFHEDKETRDSVFIDTSKCQFVPQKDTGGLEEEPMMLSFSFLRNDSYNNAFFSIGNIDKKELLDENETECSVLINGDSDFHLDDGKSVEKVQEEEETKGSNSTTSKCSLVPQNDIGDLDEEPMILSFSFLINVSYDNAFSSIENIDKKELLEHNLEEFHVSQEGDDSLTYKIIGSKKSCEEFECESLKEFEDLKETQFSCRREEVSLGFVECENEKEGSSFHEAETMYEEELDEMDYEEDEDDEDEYEWENDEVMEQIKVELRNARQGGLVTILEEEEDEEREYSSKVVEEKVKSLSIEEKMEYKDHIIEIQKVYKCYAQKIKKLDVLNYQAMHAIGLLQLKDPPKIFLMQKSTVQQAKPLVIPHNLWPRKAEKNTIDPMLKLVNELHRDLELVYVGQICLSWEILCWQHEKIKELKKYDSPWPHRYNLVSGEFQLFQVLMQRFLEDEPFQQGHRIQKYIKNRCVIRNLLQVPTIKDDKTKDKKKIKWGEEDAITSERLEQIVKESMQVFWKFLRADKDDGNVFHKVFHHKENGVKDREISELLADIQIQLHKKERKLKEKLRSGNCIVRKFQKHNEDQIQLDHEQLLAQVGLRLISKVINMKKLRKDHLIWCSEKLNQIKFVGRKIQVEYSFLLFPC